LNFVVGTMDPSAIDIANQIKKPENTFTAISPTFWILKFLGISFFSFDKKFGKLSFGKFDKLFFLLIICGNLFSIYEVARLPILESDKFTLKYGWVFMCISNVSIGILNAFYLLFKMKDCESFVKILFEFDEMVRRLFMKFSNYRFFNLNFLFNRSIMILTKVTISKSTNGLLLNLLDLALGSIFCTFLKLL
jgi:hypothetical protein